MCGIYGFSISKNLINKNKFEKEQLKIMSVRGPDHQAYYEFKENIFLKQIYHSRLSIRDLSSFSNQPFKMKNFEHTISYNGEIYNYRELKDKITISGLNLESDGDTELIYKLFFLYKEKCFDMIEGMFSCAVEHRGTLYLARDKLGIKPLYYYYKNNNFIYGSEVNYFKNKYLNLNLSLNKNSIINFVLMGSIYQPSTIYNEIKSLEPGCVLILDNKNKIYSKKFFNLKDLYEMSNNNLEISYKEAINQLKNNFEDTVKKHTISDVDIACAISAGLDSININLANKNLELDVEYFHLKFNDFANSRFDESFKLEQFKNIMNFDLKTSIIFESQNYDEYLNKMDQPTIDGYNNFLISKFIKESNKKVFLSGVGGDEIFLSYPTFKYLPIFNKLNFHKFKFNKFFRNIKFSKILNLISSNNIVYKYLIFRSVNNLSNSVLSIYDINQNDVFNFFDNIVESISLPKINTHMQISYLEYKFYLQNQLLRDSDWTSMANSVEQRVPHIDVKFLSSSLNLINKYKLSKKNIYFNSNISNFKFMEFDRKVGFLTPNHFENIDKKQINILSRYE